LGEPLKVRFYLTVSGRSPVEEVLKGLSPGLKADFVDAVLLLEQGQNLMMPLSRNLSSIEKGLHELRLKDRTGVFRFFYYIKRGEAIFFIHAFKKKKQELPLKEIEVVKKRIREI
jgi:phage-related protein